VAFRAWVALAGIMLAAGALAAVGLSAPAQKKGGTLRISRQRDIDSIDPAIAYNPDSWALEFATCAKLYNYPDKAGAEGANVVPEVATSFPVVSEDGKTQTIELRRTYRFHTGARITSANYVAAFNRDAAPELQSSAASAGYLNDILGANAVLDGKAQTISGVKALGPYLLQVRTTRALPDLVQRLTLPFFCPIAANTPPHEIDDPLGSGPYYVASRVRNRQVVLERNRFYRGTRPANVDRVVETMNGGREACRAAVEQDTLDYCAGAGIPSEDYAGVAAKYGINKKDGQFFVTPGLSVDFLAFNHDRPAFKGAGQIPLKQAINWAIDRPALVRAAGYLGAKRTDQILPPAIRRNASIYSLDGVTEQSLARARSLLAKARDVPKQLVLYAPNFEPPSLQAQIVRFDLKRIGIDVDVRYFDNGMLFEKIGTRGEPFDIVLTGWIADYADGDAFFGPLLDGNTLASTANTNFAYFDRPKYNRKIERIEQLAGQPRRQAWADLDIELMRDDPPYAPFENGVRRDFVSKSLGCYVFSPVFFLDIAAACKR